MPNTGPEPVGTTPPLEVAVGLVLDAEGRVLVSRRLAGRHLAGYWEFPGGKIDAGESAFAGLVRELHEELGIVVRAGVQCLTVRHDFAECSVALRVFRVTDWSGEVHGREGQEWAWRDPATLDPADFPAANHPMFQALVLPQRYLITPSPAVRAEIPAVVEQVQAALVDMDGAMLQVRAPSLGRADYRALVEPLHRFARARGVPLLANAPWEWVADLSGIGWHLPERRWRALDERPPVSGLVAASVHGAEGLAAAARLGLDFAVLSPVCSTASHPGVPGMGWVQFAAWVREAGVPVYALGGMRASDLDQARTCGAQGIAAIRGLLGMEAGEAAV
ncbi:MULTISPECIES: Nudix family hydrolase [unclassified Thioalkalivibrio]|uniref:Nudix family hydrolase n=1 Tax=unclassified Thioalkalivibrio TaxID=2621013 RepID=UPI00036ACBEE|nr:MULTISPECIES: Nudix family hydrolase [unclassified Thioalkalivibrio]